MDVLLALEGAALGYGHPAVLNGVDVRVRPGDFVAVVGANGSGKSTLLRGLLGSLPLQSGRRQAAPGLRLSYVPQELEVDRDLPLSAADVVLMGAWGRTGAAITVAEALARVGLEGRERSRFATLSGGQKQRALLARALVSGPQLLLLDEPVSGVDAAAQQAIYAILDAAARSGNAVVIVTHHLAALRGMATRVWRVSAAGVSERPAGSEA